jgi:hypothetical protein
VPTLVHFRNRLISNGLPLKSIIKIDNEGSEVEIVQALSFETTRAVFLEYHSLADARTIRELLTSQFHLAHEHAEGAISTYIFLRN